MFPWGLGVDILYFFSVFQFINLTFLLCEVLLQFVPSIWIIFLIILFEGLLGGAGYVNTFYKISKEVCIKLTVLNVRGKRY